MTADFDSLKVKTEARLSERHQELRDENATLHAILDGLSCGVVVANEHGELIQFNRAGAEFLGQGATKKPMSEWPDHYRFYDEANMELLPTEKRPLVRALRGEYVRDEVLVIRSPHWERSRWFSTSAGPLSLNSEDSGAMVIFTDISDRICALSNEKERSRKLQESNDELESFAYMASHDLREPLRMVESYTKILESRLGESLDEKSKRHMGYVVDGAQRMKEMLTGILKYATAGSGATTMAFEEGAEILSAARANLKMAIVESKATVSYESMPKIWCNKVRMIQLFQNLLENAITFCGPRRPDIHIAVRRIENGSFLFSVSDKGVGFDPKCSKRIFEVFQRLNLKGEYKGSGLGLTIAKQIVLSFGGEIWAESIPKQGSTFYFTLPQKPEDAP